MKKYLRTYHVKSLLIILTCVNLSAQKNDWTHFRGSNHNAISENTDLPTEWNDTTNIVWKSDIHGYGLSSPVILNNQIWLTTATKDGKEMSAVCVDFKDGKTIHDIILFRPDSVYRKHGINSYATPTPCIEEGFVFTHFGRYGTSCVKTDDGKIVWTRTDLICNHVQGPGSSPIIYKNKLILHYEGDDVQFVIALDKKTGETIWKTDRPIDIYDKMEAIGRKAYITPLVVNVNGKDILISHGSAVCIAYDLETGKEIWRIVKGEDTTITQPISEDGVVYFFTSNITNEDGESKRADLIAVNPDGQGDIAKTNVLWTKELHILQMLTPVIHKGKIYLVDTKNNMMCLDAKTGNTIWTNKQKAKFNASPLCADGKVYFSSTKGETIVIKEGGEMEILSKNKIKGAIWATPAISGKSLIIRTKDFLYRIEE